MQDYFDDALLNWLKQFKRNAKTIPVSPLHQRIALENEKKKFFYVNR